MDKPVLSLRDPDSSSSSSENASSAPSGPLALAPVIPWRCFHCDDVFTDKAEAQEHFGEYLDDSPLCLIKGQDGGLAARVRELEADVLDAYNQRNSYENDARLWHEAEADRVRRIGQVQWWQELDSREGERIVLQERVKELEAALRVLGGAPDRRPRERARRESDARGHAGGLAAPSYRSDRQGVIRGVRSRRRLRLY